MDLYQRCELDFKNALVRLDELDKLQDQEEHSYKRIRYAYEMRQRIRAFEEVGLRLVNQIRKEELHMDNIDWDKVQLQQDESNPNCPWLDHDGMSKLEKEELKYDESED